MAATLVSSSDTEVTVQFTVRLGRSMLDNEVALQQALNEAGILATQKALEAFDADGTVTVARHLSQPGGGGWHLHPMIYAQNVAQNLPVGSGVTEAACKVKGAGRSFGRKSTAMASHPKSCSCQDSYPSRLRTIRKPS